MTQQQSFSSHEQLVEDSTSHFLDFLEDLREPSDFPTADGQQQCNLTSGAISQPTFPSDMQPESAASERFSHDPLVDTEPERPKRTRSKEANRLAQQKYRVRHKARADILQASLTETQAQLVEVQKALRLLQSENKQLLRESVVARAQAQACTRPPPRHLTWQPPDVLDRQLLHRLLPLWHSGTILTCTVTSEQADDIFQVCSLGPQPMAILWQTYTQQMEANLRAGGQYGGSAAGCRLRQLLDEFSCIHSLKARGDPKGHRSLIATPLAYSGSAAAASHPPPDYQAAASMMQFTPAQKRQLFALRHSYITQLALISKRRQQLQQQLFSSPAAWGVSKDEMLDSHMTVDAVTQQLQDCAGLEHKLFIQYTIAVAHGVHSSQQCAAYLVYAYPHLADTVAATNALAEVEGEPSVADIAARVAAGMPPAVCLDVPDEPFTFDKSQISGNPNAAAAFDGVQTSSRIAEKASQVVLSTLAEDLNPQSIFGF